MLFPESHHYRARDPSLAGIYVEAPYQIVYFKIGPEYNGPYADYAIETTKEKNSEGQEEEVTKLVQPNQRTSPMLYLRESLYTYIVELPMVNISLKTDIITSRGAKNSHRSRTNPRRGTGV